MYQLSIRDIRDLTWVLLLLLGVGNWFRKRRPYAVNWTELLDEGLFERKGWLTGDLKVRFFEQEVTNPRVVLIKIHNMGQQPVRSTDYAEPLAIVLNADANIVYAQAFSSSVDVNDLCEVTANRINLAPSLLNPDDYIVVRALVDSSKRTRPKVIGRLAGVVHINEVGIKVRDRFDYVVLAALLIGFFSVLSLSPSLFGSSSVVISAMLGSGFSYIYEFARTFRYVRTNAQMAQLLAGTIDALWFTSRIPRA